MPQGSDEQRALVVEYATPAKRKPRNHAALIAYISSIVAVAALLLGIGNLLPARILIAALVVGTGTALILGIIGVRRASFQEGAGRRQAWFAIATSGFIVVLLIGLLMVRAIADRSRCQRNLSAIGSVILMYADEHGGQMPPGLGVLVRDYGVPPEIFICEKSGDTPAKGATPQQQMADFAKPGHCSYIYLAATRNQHSISQDFVLAYEPLENHSGHGAHFLFPNGWAEWRDETAARKMIEQLKKGVNPPQQ
jgi:hypothetical protein